MNSTLISNCQDLTNQNQTAQTRHHLKLLEFKLPARNIPGNQIIESESQTKLPEFSEFQVLMSSLLSHSSETTSVAQKEANNSHHEEITFTFRK